MKYSTPFSYSGCYHDTADPRALIYDPQLDSQDMTIEKCVSTCKVRLSTTLQSFNVVC